jgi:hypothetical protein
VLPPGVEREQIATDKPRDVRLSAWARSRCGEGAKDKPQAAEFPATGRGRAAHRPTQACWPRHGYGLICLRRFEPACGRVTSSAKRGAESPFSKCKRAFLLATEHPERADAPPTCVPAQGGYPRAGGDVAGPATKQVPRHRVGLRWSTSEVLCLTVTSPSN